MARLASAEARVHVGWEHHVWKPTGRIGRKDIIFSRFEGGIWSGYGPTAGGCKAYRQVCSRWSGVLSSRPGSYPADTITLIDRLSAGLFPQVRVGKNVVLSICRYKREESNARICFTTLRSDVVYLRSVEGSRFLSTYRQDGLKRG